MFTIVVVVIVNNNGFCTFFPSVIDSLRWNSHSAQNKDTVTMSVQFIHSGHLVLQVGKAET